MPSAIDLDLRFDPPDQDSWRERVEAEREGALASLSTRLEGPIEVQPLYVEDPDRPPLGRPGAPPFTRGALADGGAMGAWRLVHAACGTSPEAVVASARGARDGGADAIYLSPQAFAELDREALHAIPLPVVADPGACALAWLGALRDLEGAELRFDPLGALASTGRLPYGADAMTRWLAEMAGCDRRVFVDVTCYHHAGASQADELGFALATGVQYLRWLSEEGHPLADAPKRIGFAFASDADVFVGIAKLRAARLAWSKVLRATGIDDDAHGMRIHAFGSERAHTTLDPLVNVLRGTAAAFAGIVGGAQDVTLPAHEAGEAAERLARNTQHILRDESHLGRVLDPAGGAYYVEALTEQLARGAWATLQAIEARGGMCEALLSGHVQERLSASAAARRSALGVGDRVMVGVNRYPGSVDSSESDPESESAAESAAESVAGRPPKALRELFAEAPRLALSEAVEATPVDPRVLARELERAEGEMGCEALPVERDAGPFEALRARAASLPKERRAALVLGVGEVREMAPRVAFAREALAVAGLEARTLLAAEMPALSKGDVPPTVAVCASAPGPILDTLRELGAWQVLLVGPDVEGLDADGRLYRGMRVVLTLDSALTRLEAS